MTGAAVTRTRRTGTRKDEDKNGLGPRTTARRTDDRNGRDENGSDEEARAGRPGPRQGRRDEDRWEHKRDYVYYGEAEVDKDARAG